MTNTTLLNFGVCVPYPNDTCTNTSACPAFSVDFAGLPVDFDENCSPISGNTNPGVDIKPSSLSAKINAKPFFRDCDREADPLCLEVGSLL